VSEDARALDGSSLPLPAIGLGCAPLGGLQATAAQVFVNGGSQAVRLPVEFRFEESDEVYIRRDTVTGDVILSPKPAGHAWADFFALRDQARVPSECMAERPLNDALRPHASREEP
jgi:antitoxin VapB